MKYEKVAVLMGGLSAEREISLASGEAIARGLEEAGYEAIRVDVSRRLDVDLRRVEPDAAFIALHGRWGEDGTVQGMLEIMGIPYTGSSPAASALAMDKARSRDVLVAAGLPVADGYVITDPTDSTLKRGLRFPVVVKPVDEGSSVGVSIVRDESAFEEALRSALDGSSRALVERYVEGSEVQVAVLDGEALGTVEIVARGEFYDYDSKYAPGGSVHHVPARISEEDERRVMNLAVRTFEQLGCAGATRVDLILPEGGAPVILELNTIPGMTETSLLPEIAAHAGLSFSELVSKIVEGAKLHVG